LPSAFSDLRNGHGNAGVDLLRIEAWRQGGVGEVHGFGLLADKQYTGQMLSPSIRFRTCRRLSPLSAASPPSGSFYPGLQTAQTHCDRLFKVAQLSEIGAFHIVIMKEQWQLCQ
jgi:hypothetical protein